jgi:hypothetical protein
MRNKLIFRQNVLKGANVLRSNFMKLIIFIIVIAILMPFSVFCNNDFFDNFNYYRVTANYNGTAYNGSSILVYGDAGVCVISKDGGNNWLQSGIDDSLNIVSVISKGNVYYGVTNKYYLIKSTDDGITWQKNNITNDNLYKISYHNGTIFCLSNKSIYLYDENLNKIREYILETDTNIYDLGFSGDYLYTSGKGKLYSFNLLNDKSQIINLNDFCAGCVPENLMSSEGNLYFKLRKNLYQLHEDSTSPNFYNYYDSLPGNAVFAINKSNPYFLYNNNIPISPNLDSLYFLKLEFLNKTPIRINNAEIDRYITGLTFKTVNFISDDTLIAVGNDKLIYMSYDGGINWQLKSHLNSGDFGSISRLSDSYAIIAGKYAKFIKTTDGGVTWLPQKNYIRNFVRDKFRYPNYHSIFHASNEIMSFIYYWTDIDKDINFAYTSDGGETESYKNIDSILRYRDINQYNIYSYDDLILFAYSSIFKTEYFTVIYELSKDLNYATRASLVDSAKVLLFDKFDDKLMALTLNYRQADTSKPNIYYNIYLSLISSVDSGKTWVTETELKNLNIDISGLNSYNITRVKDNIFIPIQNNADTAVHIYKLNVKTLKYEDIFSVKNLSSAYIIGVGDKLYLSGYYVNHGYIMELLENDDIENHPGEWKSIVPHQRYGGYSIQVDKDTLLTISSYDSLTISTVKWFAKPKATPSVVKEALRQAQGDDIISYPNPTTQTATIKFDIERPTNISLKLTDMLGNQITLIKNQFMDSGSHSYDWDASGYPAGVYYYVLRSGSIVRTGKVVVVR